jgi:RNA-binding protein
VAATAAAHVTPRTRTRGVGLRAARKRPKVAAAMEAAHVVASPSITLSPAQRKRLRGLAHALEPIVRVGKSGLSEAVVSATSRALLDHELIKVRLYEPEDKHAMAGELAERTASSLCGLLGHTVILYKRHPKQPRIAV